MAVSTPLALVAVFPTATVQTPVLITMIGKSGWIPVSFTLGSSYSVDKIIVKFYSPVLLIILKLSFSPSAG